MNPLFLGSDVTLDCEALERAVAPCRVAAGFTPAARAAMADSRATLERIVAGGGAVYGTTTGFGPHVRYASAAGGGACHGAGLLAHLGAGWGPDAAPTTVRAAMLLRAHTVAQGHSGIRPAVADAYLALLHAGVTPCVPEVGSLGASGDLIPLAHIARVLTGEGRVHYDGQKMDAAAALERAGLTPVTLEGRDALSLSNGTSFLTAHAALAVARAERLIARAEEMTGWLYRLLGCRAPALDDRLHALRGHDGQRESARRIRGEAARFGPWEDASRPLQEVYSLRCAPQVLGACRENLAHARRLIETEMNGADDNPLLVSDADGGDAALHGGNFHGQQVAFAADALNAALTQVAVLADRQIDAVVTPSHTNGNAPLLLAWEPGPQSGLAGAQITATALVAEMRSRAQAHATFSIPTNGGNQDVVPMAALAARAALEQTDRLSAVLAVLALSLHQLSFLRAEGRAAGRPSPPPPGTPGFTGMREDRALQEDIERTAQGLLAADGGS